MKNFDSKHCLKSVRIRSFTGPHLPAFRLNTESYRVNIRIQSECGNTDQKNFEHGHVSCSGRDSEKDNELLISSI